MSNHKQKRSKGDVYWQLPKRKTPIAYSTKATSDLIAVLSQDNPDKTIAEVKGLIYYDSEAKEILQKYIDKGYGDIIASTWFGAKI
jgi:hypothetical protein